MARAGTATLLALDEYARVMGISLPHFNSAILSTKFPVGGRCSDVWWQYAWQDSDKASREELAEAIYGAEQDIKAYLGYSVAPVWETAERHSYPRFHRPDMLRGGGRDSRLFRAALKLRYGRFIAGGKRALAQLTPVTLVYSDADGDSANETATVSAPTTLVDECEIKIYFAGHDGDPAWEIRPARTRSISGGVFRATFWAWQLVDPDLWEQFSTDEELDAIDANSAANLVMTVDVYREYNDTTTAPVQFAWEPDQMPTDGCCVVDTGCLLVTQDGCLYERDAEIGLVVPAPATYDAGWAQTGFDYCRDPDEVRAWYYAGSKYTDCQPLAPYLAQAITWMATARLGRPFCTCGNLTALQDNLREDLSRRGEAGDYQLPPDSLGNPFGVRRGEVQAWQRISKLADRILDVALI